MHADPGVAVIDRGFVPPAVAGPVNAISSKHHSFMASSSVTQLVSFDDADVLPHLNECLDDELDALDFGVIGFDVQGRVCRYNQFESRAAGLSVQRVLGNPLFSTVAPCMNNFMVAQRFDDAHDAGVALDATIDYVLTLRMRPVKVRLRLLASSAADAVRYVLVCRST